MGHSPQHEHRDRHHAQPGYDREAARARGRKRLLVCGVALMLVALAIYVLTNDEMLRRFGWTQQAAPAVP